MANERFVLTDEKDLRDLIRTEVQTAIELSLESKGRPERIPEERFSQRQVSQRYHISEPTLIKWRKEGKLPFDEVNGRIYYKPSYLEEAFQRSGHIPVI